jgi:hypothetical protein
MQATEVKLETDQSQLPEILQREITPPHREDKYKNHIELMPHFKKRALVKRLHRQQDDRVNEY